MKGKHITNRVQAYTMNVIPPKPLSPAFHSSPYQSSGFRSLLHSFTREKAFFETCVRPTYIRQLSLVGLFTKSKLRYRKWIHLDNCIKKTENAG